MNRNQTVLKTRESSEDRVHIYENISVHDLGRSSDSKIKVSMADQNDGEVVHYRNDTNMDSYAKASEKRPQKFTNKNAIAIYS